MAILENILYLKLKLILIDSFISSLSFNKYNNMEEKLNITPGVFYSCPYNYKFTNFKWNGIHIFHSDVKSNRKNNIIISYGRL